MPAKFLRNSLLLLRKLSIDGTFTKCLLSPRGNPATSKLSVGTARGLCSALIKDGIVTSPFLISEIPELPLHELVMKNFDQFGEKVALVDGQTGNSFTYNQLHESIRRVASALVKLGFKQGDVLCVYSYNVPEYAIVYLAVSCLGGIVSAANPLYTVDELENQLKHSKSKYLVTVPLAVHTAQMAKERCPDVKEVIVFGEATGCRPFSQLLKEDETLFPENVKINHREDLIALPYSSGTTGLPKGVMLTHYNLTANVAQLAQRDILGIGYSDWDLPEAYIGLLPFFHIYGQVVTMMTGLYQGVKIVTLPRFEPEVFLDTIQKHKVTYVNLVPPIVLFMAKHPMVEKYDLSSVREVTTGAASCDELLAQEFLEKTEIPSFRQGYGLTETSPVTHMLPVGSRKIGTIGHPICHTEAKIVDVDSGKVLPPGELGELCVKGPQVMKGYLNNPEATNNTIDEDGWLRTGDIAVYDEEGFFTIKDRLKELIKYKGFQVAPAELEGILLSHSDVQDAAVIGIPDEEAGELPRAYVVQKKDKTTTQAEIAEFINAKVAPSKKIRAGVIFVDEIPKTASGKILRRVLKQEALKNL